LPPPPVELKKYYQPETRQEHDKAKNFKKWIREYNSLLSFASVRAQLRKPPGYGGFCFRIQGRIYHSVPPLFPGVQDANIEAAQYYVLDTRVGLESF
jgi:hypothetical protein